MEDFTRDDIKALMELNEPHIKELLRDENLSEDEKLDQIGTAQALNKKLAELYKSLPSA